MLTLVPWIAKDKDEIIRRQFQCDSDYQSLLLLVTCDMIESFRKLWLLFFSSMFCMVPLEPFILGFIFVFMKTVFIIDVESVLKIFSKWGSPIDDWAFHWPLWNSLWLADHYQSEKPFGIEYLLEMIHFYLRLLSNDAKDKLNRTQVDHTHKYIKYKLFIRI